ncbi:MAG: amidohydrolase [Spirochaetaceae bacterium]|nr:amidohydrolase [Spirochaetaceae bacterium]
MTGKRADACADMVFKNGRVLTVDAEDRVVEAAGVKGNRIVFAGADTEAEAFIGPGTKVFDLSGRSLLPGFIDTHFHPILTGLFGDDPEAAIIFTGQRNCKSIEDILNLVRKAAARRQRGQWISMMGYDQNKVAEKRHVTREELDQAAPHNPVQCMRGCGHVSVYNSLALASIGVETAADAAKYPPNEIVLEGDRLTGIVKDHTHFLIWSRVDYSEEQQVRALERSNDLLLRNGITSIHDPGECGKTSYRIMSRYCRQRKFKSRTYMMLHSIYGKPFSQALVDHFLALGLESGIGDDYFRLGTCKFMLDGGTSGPSCATREPYSHDPKLPGILGWEREETAAYIAKINEALCQCSAHAVGDLAVEFMVEGYEKAFQRLPRPEARHRIEHCTLTDQDLIRRMAKMNICPSCNPGFITVNGSNYTRYYGKRMRYFTALRSMIDAGIRVSISSDAPSGPVEPAALLDGCVNRIDRLTGEAVDRNEAITLMEAVRLYTYNGAYGSYEEDRKGSIEVGKLADLTVLSEDLTSLPPERISELRVELTMIDGEIEFEQ